MSKMKSGNEQKNNMIQRIVNTLVKPPIEKDKAPVHKFQYELPTSFFDAVDNARLEAGYDVLPRFHHLAVSKTSSSHRRKKQRHHHSHSQSEPKHHSSSKSDNDKNSSKRKTRSHQHNRKHAHHHKEKSSSSPQMKRSKTSDQLLNKIKSSS